MKDLERQGGSEVEFDPGRRNFLRAIGAVGATLLCGEVGEAFAQYSLDDSIPTRYAERWGYSLEEMGEIYEREYNGERLLKNCFQKRGDSIIGTIHGKEFVVPQEFTERILRHLTQMFEAGALKYVFRLDAHHGHAFMDEKLFAARYGEGKFDALKETIILTTDPDVEILYHNTEHLASIDGNPIAEDLRQKRNVIGRSKGAAIEILPLPDHKDDPHRKTVTARNRPDGTVDFYANIRFAAHKDGVFSTRIGRKEIRLDLSLDSDDYY